MPKITLNVNEIKSALASQLARIPYFDSATLNVASNALAPGGFYAPQYTLGSTFTFIGGGNAAFAGSTFQYVKVDPRSAALAAGNNLMWAAPIAGTVTATGSTTSAIKTNIDTSTITGGCNNCILSVFDAAKSIITMRRIISTTNGALTAQIGTNTIFTIAQAPDSLIGNQTAPLDAFSAVPTNGAACQLIFPNWVSVYDHTVLTNRSAGLALGTVTAGNFTLIQKKGYAQALMVGGGTAIVSNGPLAPSGVTDGILIGAAALGSTSPGVSMMASTTTVQLMPMLLDNTSE